MGRKKLELTGQVFWYLTVLYEDKSQNWKRSRWRCKCRCGNETTVKGSNLRNGNTKSCGCLRSKTLKEYVTKHGLYLDHKRLYVSVATHFRNIRESARGYTRWVLDPRYTDDANGVASFCFDLIALQPDGCERYERDNNLDLDKDNGGTTFCPECVVFRDVAENRSKHYNNYKLKDGTPFVVFCRKVGVCPSVSGHVSKDYGKYGQWFKRYNGEGHPELIKRANELIALYTKTLKLLKLREDVREFASRVSLSSH